MAKKIIRLYRSNNQWIADHEGDARVRQLFGTTRIPTIFTTTTPDYVVMAKIQSLNPDKIVTF